MKALPSLTHLSSHLRNVVGDLGEYSRGSYKCFLTKSVFCLVMGDYADKGTAIARVMRVLVDNESHDPNNMTAITIWCTFSKGIFKDSRVVASRSINRLTHVASLGAPGQMDSQEHIGESSHTRLAPGIVILWSVRIRLNCGSS